jgi:large subunit ribosomal protein L9
MKLILTQEVTGLGHPGDVVTVKDGFARNLLLPQGRAIAWSQGGEKQIEGIKRARTAREIRDRDHAAEIKASLEKSEVVIKVKVGATGSMFGSVTDKDIVAAIKSSTGVDIDRHRIKVTGHIKKLGSHTVKVNLHSAVTANVTLSVVGA